MALPPPPPPARAAAEAREAREAGREDLEGARKVKRKASGLGMEDEDDAARGLVQHAAEPRPARPASPAKKAKEDKRAMGLSAVVWMMFFTVCGGPIGCEEVIAAGGPALGLLTMLVFPWIYCFPVALVSAELSTIFPEDGSFTLWVSSSFGRFWAFQDGYWSWISGVLDNAMYPVLATELMLGSDRMHGPTGVLLTLAFSLSWSVMNFSGVEIVTRIMVLLGAVVLLPYAGLVFLALGSQLTAVVISSGDSAAGGGAAAAGVDLAAASASALSGSLAQRLANATRPDGSAPLVVATAAPLQAYADAAMKDAAPWERNVIELLHVAFWSYSGWDSVSTFAGEVRDPRRNFPLALALSITLTCASYVLPLGAGILTPGAPDWRTWSEGSFHEIGRAAGGDFMHGLIFLSTGISLLAMYCTEMFVDSFLLLGMAEQDLVPRIFAKRSARGAAPWVAIGASLLVIVVVAPLFDFTKLMQVNNCLTCMSVLIELVAAMRLRTAQPGSSARGGTVHGGSSSDEAFRAPVSNTFFVAMQIPPIAVILLVISTTVLATSLQVQLWTLAFIAAGVPLYYSCAMQDLRIE